MTITVEMEVRVREDKEAGGFVGYCPALDVYSQGETVDEALKATAEAVKLTLDWRADHPRAGTED